MFNVAAVHYRDFPPVMYSRSETLNYIREKQNWPVLGLAFFFVISPYYWSGLLVLIPALIVILLESQAENDRIKSPRILQYFFVSALVFTGFYVISVVVHLESLEQLESFSAWPACLVASHVISKSVDLKANWRLLVRAILLHGLLLAALFTIAKLRSPDSSAADVITAMDNPLLIVPNDFLFLGIISPFSILLLQNSRLLADRFLAMSFIFASLTVIVIANSRSALIAISISLFLAATILNFKNVKLLGVATLLVAGFIDLLFGFPLFQKFIEIPTSRIPLWNSAIQQFMENWAFGAGTLNFSENYQLYIETAPIMEGITIDERNIPWPHNLILELLSGAGLFATLGFIGMLLCMLAMLCEILVAGIDPMMRKLALCIVAILPACLLAILIEATLLRIWVIIVGSVLIGFTLNLRSRLEAP